MIRAQCAELDRASLDYVLLGQVMALTHTDLLLLTEVMVLNRERFSYSYYHEGIKVLSFMCTLLPSLPN